MKVSELRVEMEGKPVFKDISFDLEAGETLVILGPNGAGKTTLLRALLGLVPHRGTLFWGPGVKIGYVPQRVPLNRDLPVTVADFFELKGVSRAEASDALCGVGLRNGDFPARKLGVISSGQFQRVLIAWALLGEPSVLILDEPTAGIDAEGEEVIQSLLNKARKVGRLSMILVTHDLSAVYRQATRVLCLNGQAHRYGPPEEVLEPGALAGIYGREIGFFRHTHDD